MADPFRGLPRLPEEPTRRERVLRAGVQVIVTVLLFTAGLLWKDIVLLVERVAN